MLLTIKVFYQKKYLPLDTDKHNLHIHDCIYQSQFLLLFFSPNSRHNVDQMPKRSLQPVGRTTLSRVWMTASVNKGIQTMALTALMCMCVYVCIFLEQRAPLKEFSRLWMCVCVHVCGADFKTNPIPPAFQSKSQFSCLYSWHWKALQPKPGNPTSLPVHQNTAACPKKL